METKDLGSERELMSISCHSIRFNQDVSCVAMGTCKGFSIYNLDPIERRFHDNLEGIGKIEMLYCTSLIALVGSGDTRGSSPRRLKLCKSRTKDTICELPFSSSVLSLRMNKSRLIVVLETHIHLYDLEGLTCLQVLATSKNTDGLIALTREDSSIMALPGPSVGDVILYDCIALRLLSQILAHKSALVAMEFNRSGSILATASQTGTVIRLFRCPSGEHMCTFRRGSYPAHINSLSFCSFSRFLAVGSSTGTVHIFSLELKSTGSGSGSGSGSVLGKVSTEAVSSAGSSAGEITAVYSKSTGSHDENTSPASVSGSGSVSRNSSSQGSPVNWQQVVMDGSSLLSQSVSTIGKGLWFLGGEYLNVLPAPVQEFADSDRAVAQAKVPGIESNILFRAAIMTTEVKDVKKLKIVVITMTGILYRFSFPEDLITHTGVDTSPTRSCVLEDEAYLFDD
eukprot:CAMPEP_0182419600 /NCGR_PEP_ID=MMETSP1167-20130531/4016_1 /TAXON_ID=2988 /ORGANISM="Mallomonas Sp, Strain CCMP3275" /LENGTH=453 /DNA_ID=CAMNT_0024594601 /DNA_START=1 /DNA_END=1362 /DNA_ORIENTATION=+